MKTQLKILGLFVTIIIYTSSCKQDKTVIPTEVSGEILSKIKALGYSTKNVKMFNGGYIVEGDIFLSEENLLEQQNGLTLRIPNAEQYRTTNYLNVPGNTRTITVSTASGFPAHYIAALDTAILRYNNLSFGLEFQRVSSAGEIHLSAFTAYSGTLGYSGVPSGGNPYPFISLNTVHFTNSGSSGILYLASVITHEIGHCIGLRHTDYQDVSFSCPYTGNESGHVSGEVHIWGTPIGAEAASYMLACSPSSNFTFNTNDIFALRYVYPAPEVKFIKMFPTGGTISICTNDMVTNYSTYIDYYPVGTTVTWHTLPGIKIVGSSTGYSVNVAYDPLTDIPSNTFTYLEAHISTPLGPINIIRRFRLKRDCL